MISVIYGNFLFAVFSMSLIILCLSIQAGVCFPASGHGICSAQQKSH